jgi:hypothetical protein
MAQFTFGNRYRLDSAGGDDYEVRSQRPSDNGVLVRERPGGGNDNDIFDIGESIQVSLDQGETWSNFTYIGSFDGGVVVGRNDSFFLLTDSSYDPGDEIEASFTPSPVCFLPGTLIATPDGSRAVETLKPGDLVLTSEGVQAVKFLARTTCRLNALRGIGKMPIRIQAGALGQLGPEQDTYMSPSHAIHFDGHLVEAGALVNGESVWQVQDWADSDTITYFNIELNEHVLIWANGMMAESYFSSYRTNGFSRESWDNYSEYLALYGSSEMMTELDMPRIPFARQLPMSLRLLFQLNEPSQQDEAHPVAEALSL